MPYILDTDVVIDLLAQEPGANEFLARLAPELLYMSAITLMEAFEGTIRDADSGEMRRRLMDLAERMVLLPFGGLEAVDCARLRAELRASGRRVDSRVHDLMIAATARANSLTIVTRNVRDYADLGVDILPYA